MEDWKVGRMGKDGKEQKKGMMEKWEKGTLEGWKNDDLVKSLERRISFFRRNFP